MTTQALSSQLSSQRVLPSNRGFLFPLATIGVHLFTNGRYGFHRDELDVLDNAQRLAWGYVAYPPVISPGGAPRTFCLTNCMPASISSRCHCGWRVRRCSTWAVRATSVRIVKPK